jgi:hypothetical protein
MMIYFILIGMVFFSIVITTVQIRSSHKKELNELLELFEDIES